MKIDKEKILQRCKEITLNKRDELNKIIDSQKRSLEGETKSSAGDKHETGRAMIQLEMEKSGQQYLHIQNELNTLSRIKFDDTNDVIRLGTVIRTKKVDYFIAISLGKIAIDDHTFFAISPTSPLGRLFIGKQSGDAITFNGQTICIDQVY